MTASTYAVGRGKPPLHTRFKKGQSGNPSGKPGPAKLAKERFQRVLYAALEGSTEELELAKPANGMVAMARRMVLDATGGRVPALRLVLSLLDADCRADDARAAQEETDTFSLLQGKTQGSELQWLEDLLWPDDHEEAAGADIRNERVNEPAPAGPKQNRAEPVSLVQGKKQGNGKNEQICFAPGTRGTPAMARGQLMMSSAAVTSRDAIRFRPPGPIG
jgi:hypothetical protein